MQYYTYKITFKDLPCYFYYGSHKDNGKLYYGSPTTWKRLWKIFEPEVQILQWYETTEEAYAAEESIIRATWDSKYSLNEHVGGRFSEESCRKNGKANAATGLAAMSRDTLVANGKANLATIPRETLVANGKANVAVMRAALTPEILKANGKANVAVMRAALTPEILKANAKTTNSQRWQCLVTGFVSNPGHLSRYQRGRGIDTSMRIRVE
jgi:hypothetical protein